MLKSFTIIFFFFTAITSAQIIQFDNIELDFSEATAKETGNIMSIAGELKDSIYALSRTKKEFFFQTFDSETKELTSSKPFKIEKDYEIRDYIIVGEKVFLMLSSFNEVSKSYHFIAKEIKDNQIINSTIIFSIKSESRSRKGEFLYKLSEDASKYLVTHVNKNYRNPSVDYTLVLVDENLDKVFTDTNTIASQEKRVWSFKVSDTKFNKNGDIFLTIIESYRDKSEKNKFNKATIYSYQANNNFNRREVKIELKDIYLADCSIIPTRDNRLHIIGFYSSLKKNAKRQWYLKGIYDIVINNQNKEIIKKNFHEFPDYLYDVYGVNKRKKERGLFYSESGGMNIEFIERNDGGIILLSEGISKGEPNTLGIWPLAWTTYNFSAGHVILTALNSDGTLDWDDFIPKIQWLSIDVFGVQLIPIRNYTRSGTMNFPMVEMGTGEEYLSILPIYKNGKLTVLYNDHHKTTEDNLRILEGINRMETVAYSFDDKTGEATRYDFDEVDKFDKQQLRLKPLIRYKVSNSKYLIYGGNKKENALGELRIK